MRILLLNQCFYPDVVATAQQLSDLARGLVEKGHDVTVVASDRGYDNSERRFLHRETWNGIKIIRISSLTLGKKSRWRRAATFASFLLNCSLRLLLLPRFDVVVALTSPPLISFLGALFVRLKGGKFFFWVMDLNPDEAIAAGWLQDDSVPANFLKRFLNYSLRNAEGVIALDRFMKQRIVAKGIPSERVTVLPPWAHDDNVRFDQQGREAFRLEHDLANSFVVMYAGNHSPCHPLDTLIEAARRLPHRPDIVFCFVGGGSEQQKVSEFATTHQLQNIRIIPYQPLEKLAGSLSAADLHVLVMGVKFVGIVHPSKLYNIMTIGSPLLYIGPRESHATEIINLMTGDERYSGHVIAHGDVEAVVAAILQQAKLNLKGDQHHTPDIAGNFSKQTLLPRMIEVLESSTMTASQSFTSARADYISTGL